jgi:hypothetical protein
MDTTTSKPLLPSNSLSFLPPASHSHHQHTTIIIIPTDNDNKTCITPLRQIIKRLHSCCLPFGLRLGHGVKVVRDLKEAERDEGRKGKKIECLDAAILAEHKNEEGLMYSVTSMLKEVQVASKLQSRRNQIRQDGERQRRTLELGRKPRLIIRPKMSSASSTYISEWKIK